MKIKLIMVDLDGTLFDTKEVNYYAYKEAIGIFGYSIDYDFFCKKCNGKHYLDFLSLLIKDNKDVMYEIHEKKKMLYSKYLNKARINSSLVDLLKMMKGQCKLALVTTASKENTYELLNSYSLVHLFDLILTQKDVTNVKPNPEGYIKAMDYFGILPAESIVFEDSDVGIEAADRSGASVYVVRGYN